MGDFVLSLEHAELRRALRRFAEEEIAPYAAEVDERAEFPWKSFEAYRASGFVRMPYPAEYGGDGADMLAYALLVEEVARVCGSSSLFVLISRLACDPIIRHGSEALKQRIISKVASGEWQGSYCLSEPQAGSDVAAISTRAVRDGDHWVLNGRKLWITNAGISDLYTVFAKTDSGTRCPRSIAPALSSVRRPWALRKEHSTPRSRTRPSDRSSGHGSPTSKASSSWSPTS